MFRVVHRYAFLENAEALSLCIDKALVFRAQSQRSTTETIMSSLPACAGVILLLCVFSDFSHFLNKLRL